MDLRRIGEASPAPRLLILGAWVAALVGGASDRARGPERSRAMPAPCAVARLSTERELYERCHPRSAIHVDDWGECERMHALAEQLERELTLAACHRRRP